MFCIWPRWGSWPITLLRSWHFCLAGAFFFVKFFLEFTFSHARHSIAHLVTEAQSTQNQNNLYCCQLKFRGNSFEYRFQYFCFFFHPNRFSRAYSSTPSVQAHVRFHSTSVILEYLVVLFDKHVLSWIFKETLLFDLQSPHYCHISRWARIFASSIIPTLVYLSPWETRPITWKRTSKESDRVISLNTPKLTIIAKLIYSSGLTT